MPEDLTIEQSRIIDHVICKTRKWFANTSDIRTFFSPKGDGISMEMVAYREGQTFIAKSYLRPQLPEDGITEVCRETLIALHDSCHKYFPAIDAG